jgi:hypothetical protein
MLQLQSIIVVPVSHPHPSLISIVLFCIVELDLVLNIAENLLT